MTPARLAALRAAGGGRCLAAAAALLEAVPEQGRYGRLGGGKPVHDACAIAWALAPALFTVEDREARVELAGEARGRTVFEAAGTPNARLLTTIDAEGFFRLLGERLARLA